MISLQMLKGPSYAALVATLLNGGAFSFAQDQCMRGKPEPVFSKASRQFKYRRFKLVNSHEANERVRLSSGAEIQIRHWGCEYYAITFTITEPDRHAGPAGMAESLIRAAGWLRELQPLKGSLIFDFGLAALALDQMAKANPNIAYGEEIPVPGDGTDFLQTQLTFTQPDLPKQANQIIITFSKGPL